MIIPKYLKKGDTIAVVSPSGSVSSDLIYSMKSRLENEGFKVKLCTHSLDKTGRFAGSDEDRLSDLQSALDDNSVSAIICGRGGYGVTRIIDRLDFSAFKKNPKFVVGFSDITALHAAILQKTGVVSVHGPMARAFFDAQQTSESETTSFKEIYSARNSVENLLSVLTGSKKEIRYTSYNTKSRISSKVVKGELHGGNLTLLTVSKGTGYDVTNRDGILFIEEVGERMYSVDRMLQGLRSSGTFAHTKGLVLGDFSDMDRDDSFGSLEAMVERAVEGYDFPVLYDMKFGHEAQNRTMLSGATARIEGCDLVIEL